MLYKLSAILLIVLLFGCEEQQTPENNGEISIKEESIQNSIPVEAIEIKSKVIEQTLPLTGILQPNNSVDLIAEVAGKVTKIEKQLGDYVKAQQTLAIIDDVIPESQYNQAKAQVLSAESNLNIAEANYESDKMLFENGDISELALKNSRLTLDNAKAQHLSAIAALSATKKSYEDTRINSPISGYISRKNIEYGTMVTLGTRAYRVVDLSKLKLMVSVPQEVINSVRIGSKANVTVSALNNTVFQGSVKRISPQADEVSGGFSIEIQVPNDGYIMKAGMTAKIELLLLKEDEVIAIPEYSIVMRNSEPHVYKINDNYAELVKVSLGESVGENIIVNDGLTIGDKVVTVGMKNLGVKTKVKVEKIYNE